MGSLLGGERLPFEFPFPETFLEKSEGKPLDKIGPSKYVYLNSNEMESLMPEGFPVGLREEFAFSGEQAWMCRDVSNLLCKVINGYESSLANDYEDNNEIKIPINSVNSKIELNGLTNRSEWSDASITVRAYGKKLNPYTSHDIDVNEDNDTIEVDADYYIDQVSNMETFPKKILIAGGRGNGKSTSLAQMVLHARRRGWICVYIPNGCHHISHGSFVEPVNEKMRRTALGHSSDGDMVSAPRDNTVNVTKDEILGSIIVGEDSNPYNPSSIYRKSYYKEDPANTHRLFNNSWYATDFLRDLIKVHEKELSQIPIYNENYSKAVMEYFDDIRPQWDRALLLAKSKGKEMNFILKRRRYEGKDNIPEEDEKDSKLLNNFDFDSFQPKTLADLCLSGIAFRDSGGLVAMMVIEALKNLEASQGPPVLMAVDEYNSWFGQTSFYYKQKMVQGSEMCIPSALQMLSKKKSDNQDENNQIKNGLFVAAVSQRYPESLGHTMKDTAKSIPLLINVPCYSQKEYISAVNYYMYFNRFLSITSTQRVLAYRTYTGSVPRQMRLDFPFFCADMKHPLAMEESEKEEILRTTARLMADVPPEVGDTLNGHAYPSVSMSDLDDVGVADQKKSKQK